MFLSVWDNPNFLPKFVGGLVLLALVAGIVIYFSTSDIKAKGKVTWSTTRNIAILSVMATVSSLAMLVSFDIIPATPFLKLEFSVLIIFLVFIWFDFKSAIIVSVITNIVNAIIKGGWVAFLDQGINFIATMVFLIPFAMVFRKYCLGGNTKEFSCEINLPVKKMILTGIGAVLLTTVVMVFINILIVIPVYDNLFNNEITNKMENVSDNYYLAVIQTFGLFNVIHWGSIAVVIVLFGRRLVKIKQYIN